MSYFHTLENAILALFKRTGGTYPMMVRRFGDGSFRIDYSLGFNGRSQTCKGRIVTKPNGKFTIYLRGKQLTTTIVGGSSD